MKGGRAETTGRQNRRKDLRKTTRVRQDMRNGYRSSKRGNMDDLGRIPKGKEKLRSTRGLLSLPPPPVLPVAHCMLTRQ